MVFRKKNFIKNTYNHCRPHRPGLFDGTVVTLSFSVDWKSTYFPYILLTEYANTDTELTVIIIIWNHIYEKKSRKQNMAIIIMAVIVLLLP